MKKYTMRKGISEKAKTEQLIYHEQPKIGHTIKLGEESYKVINIEHAYKKDLVGLPNIIVVCDPIKQKSEQKKKGKNSK